MSLRELAVRDLALIERVRVSFAPGFTVITGETGAGKSLLIDALSLVMGGRADPGLIRHGAETGRVEALFERDGLDSEPLICVRELGTAGRSVARIDDETVTAARLAAVVGPLVEIHGQHDQQRLLLAAWQRDVLDAYGEHAGLRAAVAERVRALRANEAALRELALEPAELQRRIELAEHAAVAIEKRSQDGRTVTEVRQLDDGERQREMALMLGGSGRDEGALTAASELLARARGLRESAAAVG